MSSEDAIQQAISKLSGTEKFFGRREIKELPKILWEDELPERVVQGLYNNSNGILVATNKRLIFIDKGIFSLKVEDFPYDKMSSIQYRVGLLWGEIIIFTSGNKAEIKQVLKGSVRDFADYVRARITSPIQHASVPVGQVSQSNTEDVVTQLEKLAKLKEQGILTEEEFQAKKKQLLGI